MQPEKLTEVPDDTPVIHVYLVSPSPYYNRRIGRTFMPPQVLAILQGMLTESDEAPYLHIGGVTHRLVVHPHDEGLMGQFYPSSMPRNSILCLSFLTTAATRAKRLAEESLSRGVRVICGGYHTTALPEQVRSWANVAWAGEIMPSEFPLLLAEVYTMPVTAHEVRTRDPKDLPFEMNYKADWTGIPVSKCWGISVRFSTGCPWGCHFCGATNMSGSKMRLTRADCLEWELAHLPNVGPLGLKKPIVIASDDNVLQGWGIKQILAFVRMAQMLGKHRYSWVAELSAKTLLNSQEKILEMSRAAECDISWQRILNILKPYGYDLCRFAAAKGAITFYFGMEMLSDSQKGAELSKQPTRDELCSVIRNCHTVGISVAGAFILGLEGYGNETVDEIVAFAEKNGLDAIQLSIATPIPGSLDFTRAVADRALLSYEWDERFDCSRALTTTLRERYPDIETDLQRGYDLFYSRKSIGTRLPLRLLLSPSRRTRARIVRGLAVNWSIHGQRPSFMERWAERVELPDTAPEPPEYLH